jgi:hypothetical protein
VQEHNCVLLGQGELEAGSVERAREQLEGRRGGKQVQERLLAVSEDVDRLGDTEDVRWRPQRLVDRETLMLLLKGRCSRSRVFVQLGDR